MFYPRILIVSNNCLSKSDSNGRTLGNFVSAWPKENVAQFCIHDRDKDWDVCSNYYVISDAQAVKAFVLGKKYDGRKTVREKEEAVSSNTVMKKGIARTPASMLLRDIAWKSLRWKKETFDSWVNEFDPEVVLFQAGDLPAFYDVAVKLAKDRNIPLVIYNSEEYYFKDYCYFGEDASFKWLYPLFHKRLKKSVKNALQYAVGSIYISDYLKELYDTEFGRNSITVMTSATDESRMENKKSVSDGQGTIVYGGNLGIGRHKALIEIGEALQYIDENLRIDVYGKSDDQGVIDELSSSKGVNYVGMVPYQELQKKTKKARLLVHVESTKPYYLRDIKYGFSTKIADSLASGVPFFVYASDELTSVQYLKDNNCAIIATDREQLVRQLKTALFDEDTRKESVDNALKIAAKNHSMRENKNKFYEFIIESLELDKSNEDNV